MTRTASDHRLIDLRLQLIVVTLGAMFALLAQPAAAQRVNQLSEPAGNGSQLTAKTDWSGNQDQNQVNSFSQPTRFDVKSSIPDSRTGNEQFQTTPVSRERGGPLLDRLQQSAAPGRAAPITR